MSPTPKTLDTAAWTQPGAAYAALRSQAVALVQAMSGEVWTDYNHSDPGVTIIEQLCYALTELPYRADVSMVEILSPPDQRFLPLRRQGLQSVRSIMPCNPVTANDFRRLVVDRVPAAANVWFTPRTGRGTDGPADGIAGLYEVSVLPYEDYGRDQDAKGGGGPDRIARDVMRCYTAHRSLCEDAGQPVVLRGIDVYVQAVVVIAEEADPSDTLARILYALGLFLAPEPRRTSLDERLDAGARTTDIFVGPLMLRGFIPDDQLTAFPATVTIEQLRKVVAQTPGVSTVDGLSVTIGSHGGHTVDKGRIEVPPGAVFRVRSARHGHPTIKMIRDEAICQPNQARTRRRLAELWKDHRRIHPLWESYPEHYGTPASQYRPLSSYMSVQNQFPAIYGIGRNATHYRASTVRMAQANQLKGYLMVFDQLLADYFAQLAFVRELLSVKAGGQATYAVQSLRTIVPGAEVLLGPGYEEGLAEVSAETDPVNQRQNAVLDLLLSFYSARIDRSKQPAGQSSEEPGAAASLIHAKQSMLRRVDFLTRNRGKGLDYQRPASVRSVSGVERMSRLQLELLDRTTGEGQGSGQDDDPVAVRHPSEASFGKLLPTGVVLGVQHLFKPVGDGNDDRGGGTAFWRGPSPLAGQRVAAGLLAALHDRSNYRFIQLEGSGSLVVVCVDVDGRWWLIGEYRGAFEALAVLEDLIRAAGDHHWRRGRHRDLHIVEWILLRYAWKGGEEDGRRYNFRITAVLAADMREGNGENWRSESQDILRENTPAHVALDCLYLDQHPMETFRSLYDDWVEALRNGSPKSRSKTSRRLERFLVEQGAAAPDRDDAPPDPSEKRDLPEPSGGGEPARAPEPPEPAPAPSAPSQAAPSQAAPSRTVARPAVLPSPATDGDPGPPLGMPPSTGDTPPPAETSGSASRGSWLKSLFSRLKKRKPAKGTGDAGEADTARKGAGKTSRPETGSTTAEARRPSRPTGDSAPTDPADPPNSSRRRLRGGDTTSPPPPATPSPGAQSAPPGAIGFDTATVLTASNAAAFAARGYTFAIRYLSRLTPEASGDLDSEEVADILGAGLALMAVQHVAAEGWVPSRSLGQQYGRAAVANATAAGLVPGISLWLDLEGVAAGTSADAVIQYCNAWFQVVTDGGYLPGLYVGANCGLDGQQLGSSLDCDYFWRSGSDVPDVVPMGYCMEQTIDSDFEIDGVTYDRDVVQSDNGGKTPVWMAATTGVSS